MSDDSPIPPSPVPIFEDDEEPTLNGVSDVPKPLREWAGTQSRRTKRLDRRVSKVERHFETGGMVADLHEDWSAVKKGFNFWIKVGPILGAILIAGISALMWLIHASVAASAPQPPAPPSAQDIAREVVRQQSQQK